MSTSPAGVITSSLSRSTIVVPPASTCQPSWAPSSLHRVGQAGRAVVGEVAHGVQPRRASRTISTAATMFG